MEYSVSRFWKGFPGRKNSMSKGREAWQGTYKAGPARTGHRGAGKWCWTKLGGSWSLGKWG